MCLRNVLAYFMAVESKSPGCVSRYLQGVAQGRALAGVGGLPGSRVFAHRMRPELIAVGETYCAGDGLPDEVMESEQPISMWEEDEAIHFSIANDY